MRCSYTYIPVIFEKSCDFEKKRFIGFLFSESYSFIRVELMTVQVCGTWYSVDQEAEQHVPIIDATLEVER